MLNFLFQVIDLDNWVLVAEREPILYFFVTNNNLILKNMIKFTKVSLPNGWLGNRRNKSYNRINTNL